MADWSAGDNSRGSKAAAKASPMIAPSHKGLLHKKLGVPQGQKIPSSDLAIKPGDPTKLKEEKSFASNFGK